MKKKLESPVCASCGADNYKIKYDQVSYWQHQGVFRIVECRTCGLIYVHPRPTLAEIGAYYPAENYWGDDIESSTGTRLPANWRQERTKGYLFLYDLISQLVNSGPILDVGAGTGVFLSWFKENGWQTLGTELSQEAVQFGKKMFGVPLLKGDLLSLKIPKNYFRVVTLNNVLEHLHQPKQTLEKIHTSLTPRGIVVITVPNSEALGLQLFGKKSHLLQPPRHLYHFSKNTLTKLLEDTGFTVIGTRYDYWEHNYYSMFESFRLRFSPKFQNTSFDVDAAMISEQQHSVSLKVLVKRCISLGFKAISHFLAWIGQLTGKSEVICVYAIKRT